MTRFCLIFASLMVLTFGQKTPDQTDQPEKLNSTQTAQIESVDVLRELLEQIQSLESPNDNEQEAEETEDALERLSVKFDELVAGKESLDYFSTTPEETSFQKELIDIFEPLIGEIKNATSNSREKDFLRNQIELLLQRKNATDSALLRIRKLINTAEKYNDPPNTTLIKKLQDQEKTWTVRQEQAAAEYESAKLQLEEKERNSSNAVETASRTIARFFQNRGLHLLIGIFSAIAVFCILHYGYRYLVRFSPFHKPGRLDSTAKIIDGAQHLITFILTCFTLLLAFFLCDDWVLLSASLLILVGLIWALKDRLAGLTEEIRLILNIGSVREGERIFFEGLSWKVDKIRVYSKLSNPELDGGVARIPISSMVGLRSRPCAGKDRYFPTSTNDWVILSDGTFGKVLRQSPEFVELIKLGGARKTYPTQDFLAQSPENLSISQFRISSTFGIDYKHQSTATNEIQDTLQAFIKDGLISQLDNKEHLKRLNVEFYSASASSLDFIILADFSSSLAPKYNVLKRLLQKLAVEACNENNWEIPFNQLTINQAQP